MLPAASNKAGADATAELLLVLTLCEMKRLPVSVFIEMRSVELRPLYVVPARVIEPISSASALITLSAPSELPEAIKDKALFVLFKVIA